MIGLFGPENHKFGIHRCQLLRIPAVGDLAMQHPSVGATRDVIH